MSKAAPAIARGERIYAIGDVHGRLDLLAELLELICEDTQRSPARRTRIVILGDFIDRGPAAAPIVDTLMKLTATRRDLVVLRGNHEQSMLSALRGDTKALETWLSFGGDATLRSWGLSYADLSEPAERLIRTARSAVGTQVLRWLAARPLAFRSGDFFFVHAGVRPGVALARQSVDDLLWIRAPFLDNRGDLGAVIVHGHTIYEHGPQFEPGRIGVDTGAYRTGRLSAVGFERTRQWVIAASGASKEVRRPVGPTLAEVP